MKILRNIAFIMTAVVAVAFTACDGGEEQPTEKTPFEVHYDGKVITKDTTISLSTLSASMMEQEGKEIVFEATLINVSEKDYVFSVTEERQFDLTKYYSYACLESGDCVPFNKEKSQEYEFDTLVPEEEKGISCHFVLSKEALETNGTFTSVYSFSNEKEVIKVTVNYVYEK